jgi:hypothetical protein
MTKQIKKVEIELKLLKRIAEYYEFPLIVFFGDLNVFKEFPKTRNISLSIKADAFDKIKEIVEEIRD